jgi:hypothetical protein
MRLALLAPERSGISSLVPFERHLFLLQNEIDSLLISSSSPSHQFVVSFGLVTSSGIQGKVWQTEGVPVTALLAQAFEAAYRNDPG